MKDQSDLIDYLNWEDEAAILGYICDIVENPQGIFGFVDGIK